jgi:hypothetical protein
MSGHTMKYADARLAVWTRALGRCEICGVSITMDTMQAHHRLSRSVGADCVCNLLALCGDSHRSVHSYGAESRELGWIISKYDQRAPSNVPVVRRDPLRVGAAVPGVWVLLYCDTGIGRVPFPPPMSKWYGSDRAVEDVVYDQAMTERRVASFRLTATADKLVNQLAAEHKTDRGTVLRALMSTGAAHMDEVNAKIDKADDE